MGWSSRHYRQIIISIKFWCYIIDFASKNNKFVYYTKEDITGDFTLNDKFSATHPSELLNLREGLETLGVFIAMDENQTDQLNNLRNKSEVFSEQFRTIYCN